MHRSIVATTGANFIIIGAIGAISYAVGAIFGVNF